ncbi:MAG TPA: lipid-binding SYLF domain-containing protein [Burkholderiales bacterium]|nr:lipid-binding SYLF domain-containing protein [Burkholderiales bacterium]
MTPRIHAALIALAAALAVGCASVETTQEKEALAKGATASRQAWINADPSIDGLVKKSYGYAFFPDVGSGGFIVAGSHGNGIVYEQGQQVGYAELTGGSVGLTVGGQKYSELIVFEDKVAMDRFKKSEVNFGANANAIIAKTGAGASASFVDGVVVFVRPLAGAMAEASVGGQKIKYVPK